MKRSYLTHLSLFAVLAGSAACAETIDETDDPLGVGAQRRTTIEVPCTNGDDDCTEALTVESAASKDDDVIDVVSFGEGFVLVEAVGEGETKVIAEGERTKVKITYLVESDSVGELHVSQPNIEVLRGIDD